MQRMIMKKLQKRERSNPDGSWDAEFEIDGKRVTLCVVRRLPGEEKRSAIHIFISSRGTKVSPRDLDLAKAKILEELEAQGVS